MWTAELNTANFHVPHAAHMPPCRKIEFVPVPQLVQAFHGCDIMFARVLITKRAAIAATVRANLNESANNARKTEHTNSDTYRQNKRETATWRANGQTCAFRTAAPPSQSVDK
jgi:hypothetical protein